MAGIDAVSTVHRQATFETNRLRLQRGSLDLPVIDSGEEAEQSKPSLKNNRPVNHKSTVNEPTSSIKKEQGSKVDGSANPSLKNNRPVHHKDSESEPTSSIKKEHGSKVDSIAKTQSNKVQTSHNSTNTRNAHDKVEPVVNKKEAVSTNDSKPKVQATKSYNQNKSDSQEQKIKKVTGSNTDKNVNSPESKRHHQLDKRIEQANKQLSPDRKTLKVDESRRNEKALDSNKSHKKESVLSKLNANKSAKTDDVSKQEANNHTPQNQTKHTKTQNKQSDSEHKNLNNGKSNAESKVVESISESSKPLKKQSDSKGDSNPKSPRVKNEKVRKGTNITTRLNGQENSKQEEKKRGNLQDTALKSEKNLLVDEKQDKTSGSKGFNSKGPKSPDRKPVISQSVDHSLTKRSTQGAPKPKVIETDSEIIVANNQKVKHYNNDDKLQPVIVNKEQIETKSTAESQLNNKGVIQSTQSKTIKSNSPIAESNEGKSLNHNSEQHNSSSVVNNSVSNRSNSSRSNKSNSPRSNKSHSPVPAEKKILSDELLLNKAPVGTSLNEQTKKRNQSIDTKENGTEDDIDVLIDENKRAEQENDPITQNPLIERLHIEQPGKKMEVRRHEPYESVYAERNTLLKAEVAYKKRIKQLEDEANGFLKVIEDLTHENKSLRKKIDMLEDEMNSEGKTNFVERLEDMEEENRTLKTLMKEQKEVISQFKHTTVKDEHQTELRNLKQQIVQLQTDNQMQNEENVKLKAEYYESVKKLNAMAAEKQSDGAVKGTAVGGGTRKTTHALQNENADLKKKVNSLEFENDALSQGLEQKKTELKEILGVMKDENKFDNELKDLRNEVLKLKKEKRELELEHVKEKRDIQGKLQETKSQLSEKITHFDELKIKADELETECSKLKTDASRLNQDKDSLQKELDKLRAEVSRLEKELQDSKELYSNLLSETESASNDLKDTKTELEKFNRDLQLIVADKENQISKLIAQLDSLRQERELEKKRILEEKNVLTEDIERLKVFETNYPKKEKELQLCQENLEGSELKRKKLSITLEDRGFEVSNLQQQVFELSMKLDNYSKRMTQLDKDKRDMEVDKREWEIKKDKVNDIESSNKRLLEENRRLRNQLEATTALTPEYKVSEPPVDKEKGPHEAWVNEKANQQAMYISKERGRKKVHTLAEHSVSKKRQPYTKSSPVRSNKQRHSKGETLKVGLALNSSRSLEDIRRTPESLPEVNKDPRLTFGGAVFGGYTEIHRNKVRAAANKRVY